MIRRLLLIAAWGALALPLAAQKTPAYDCWVMDSGPTSIVLGIAKDSNVIFKNGYQLPNSLDGVKAICRSEIVKFTVKDAAVPIPAGQFKVDLSLPDPPPPPPPPPPPTQDEIDQAKLVQQVAQARKLAGIVPADSGVLLKLQQTIEATLEAHPDWIDSF